jgi:hypothetical protein
MPRWTWSIVLGMAAGLLAGCEPKGEFKTAQQIKEGKQAAGQPVHDGEHEHSEGPHGGAIVELGGEEYHGEVVIYGKMNTITVYVLGKDAKTAAPIAAEEVTVVTEENAQLKLKAAPQEGEDGGKASKFELTEESSVGPIVKAGYLHGALQLAIDGKPYRGNIDWHDEGSSHDDHADEKAEPKQEPEAKEAPEGEPAADKSDS